MKWGQYIKRTAVRRVVWIVVGLLAYAFLAVIGVARAQATPLDRGQAYAQCVAERDALIADQCAAGPPQWVNDTSCAAINLQETVWVGSPSSGTWTCRGNAQFGGGEYTNPGVAVSVGWNVPCPAGTSWNDQLKMCARPCDGLSPKQGNVNTSLHAIVPTYCVNGCSYNASNPLCAMVEEGPTAGYWCNVMYNPTGGQCTAGPDEIPNDPNAPEPTCSEGEVRLPNGQCSPRGQCPVGQHEVDGACHPLGNCPPYHVKAPDGSCTPVPCPSGQARGNDGTCKADGNSDGTPDEEGPEGDSDNKDGMVFSGGQSCSVPPTCSGDPIMCGQARIQWQIECNTRRAESVEGGNACDIFNMPICIGEGCDPVQHKQLIIQWEAMCALRELVSQDGDGEGDGGGDLGAIEDGIDRIGDFLDGGGNCMSTEEGCDPVEVPWDDEAPENVSWSSGLSSTGSCPAPVSTTITLAGYAAPIEFSYQPICDFAALMRWVLITAATIVSGLIVAGVRSTGGGA